MIIVFPFDNGFHGISVIFTSELNAVILYVNDFHICCKAVYTFYNGTVTLVHTTVFADSHKNIKVIIGKFRLRVWIRGGGWIVVVGTCTE